MKGFIFLKKELMESYRTPKAIILILIFFFCGVMSPLGARYINELLEATGQLGGFKLPDPTWMDAFTQFFKNNQSIAFIALLLTFMNSVAGEKKSGTAVLILSKGLKRRSFIYSKYVAGVLVFLAAYIVSIAMTVFYSNLLFDDFSPVSLIPSMAVYGLTGTFYIAIAILASVLASSSTSAAIMSIGAYAFSGILEIIPALKKVLPGKLMEISFDLIKGNGWIEGSFTTIAVIILLTVVLLEISVVVFNRQEL